EIVERRARVRLEAPVATFRGPPLVHAGFDDVDAAHAVDEVDEIAAVHGDVVRRGAVGAGRGVRKIVCDLTRGEWVGDVEQAQALREPRERNDGAGEALGRLVTTGHRLLKTAVPVDARDIDGGDRRRQRLFG